MPKTVGAPSQHSQPSRKGKKAWRKNVDIQGVEEGLEDVRDQERITGVKKKLPKFDYAQLPSAKILAQRSALPALYSRPSKPTRSHSTLTREEKGRLLRMGKRKVKGPFNGLVDPTEMGAGSAMLEPTEAVKQSGKYDMWNAMPDPTITVVKGKGKYKDPQDFLIPLIIKPNVKPPKSVLSHHSIPIPAVLQPHQGTSYNPLETAHKDLLLGAHEIELRREAEAAKFDGVKERMESARRAVAEEIGAAGMIVDKGDGPDEDEGRTVANGEDPIVPTHKAPPRKTQKQRRKAAQILAERRALMDQRRRQRFLAAIPSARAFRSQAAKSLRARLATIEARRAKRAAILKQRGLIGQRLGKHRVPAGQVDFQLGEELTETLRELKPQGNLFRDRFLSLQQRALVEPRVPVLPKRRKTKTKEYEKHAWKRFDRD
ncbi:tumor suppressor protein Gltscr2 [Hysterangium stoloniferum]|nr:tumor suppressor protein Gltscr2 [Hysterangium stoloniferum]